MDTSLLYHGFGIKGQEVIKTEYKSGNIIVYIQTKPKYLRCSQCRSTEVIRKGFRQRMFRTTPIGLKPVFLLARVNRLECKACGAVQQELLPYAEQKKAIPID